MKIIRVKTKNQRVLSELGQAVSKWARVVPTNVYSLESQQLQAVGAMPRSDIVVIDPRTIRQAELASIVASGEDENAGHDLLVVKHPDESTTQRIDREELEGVLKDSGFNVFNTTQDVVKYVENKRDEFQDETSGSVDTGISKSQAATESHESTEGDPEFIEKVSRIVHETLRFYCRFIGDYTHLSWDRCPEDSRQSTLDGVTYHLQNPKSTPEQSHARWMEFRKSSGWSYGSTKDVVNKQHPCMVPYDDLPEQQKLKDLLFCVLVNLIAREFKP